ncbi:MAG: formate--tetrahydrofolate ligase [Thermoplasmata archaeon]|nr:formate--tetrahydrofolate ligase [Thermoplasmata archaeon]
MKSDLEIAQEANMKPIVEIAKQIGLEEEDIELYGKYKAKIKLEVLDKLKDRPDGKYIDVTAITPTPLGEGKTVINIGLSQALAKIGKNIISTLREPSMGPVFGIKGGAAGGGYSQVVPMEDINLHFTGDIHAVGAANNLLAAMVDNQIFHPTFKRANPLNIDASSITWRRVVDLNDSAMTTITLGTQSKQDFDGYPRDTGMDITVASEVMAILTMASDLKDLRQRLSKIIVAKTKDGKPVTAEELKAAGAMTVVLKEALKPNLVQTLENGACIMHAGPFANIAIGNNSVIADRIALKLADYVVTESGFAADCGAEKLLNIKCRQSGLKPDCIVINATIRALKLHGGGYTSEEDWSDFPPGKRPPDEVLWGENVEAVRKGCVNLAKHIENMKKFGVPAVVCVNRFGTDTDAEVEAVVEEALKAGADSCVPCTVHADGGDGGIELAKAVVEACEKPNNFKLLYPDEASIKEKIETLAKEIYGADGVEYSELAEEKIKLYTEWGLAKLPLCIAKTHLSLSHDPSLKGAPSGFILPVRDIRPSAGAGFLYPLCGEMRTMPGLPSHPAAEVVDIDENGKTLGLF